MQSSHSMRYFGAKEVMSLKKPVGQFRGEVISDMTDRCKRRLPGYQTSSKDALDQDVR
ncbi:MAG: hypothetical protein ACRED0_10315 [Gammaproteobacteria bacterium]